MIYVDNIQSKVNISEKEIEGLKETILKALMEEEVKVPCEVSLLFVDNEKIREINRENRGIDRETDVLSFPMLDYEDKKVFKEYYKDYNFDETYKDGDEVVLGDIVLSLEKSLEQSKEYNHSFLRETSYLVVHSVLHLLGYDHMEENDKVKMRKREEEILELLNIRR
ncbi:MAG: rRNA maturation RNase YbeY [Clostridiales bacterium]|nr:rRNA maturation RNase YbeY [Clostridiales bacterium]